MWDSTQSVMYLAMQREVDETLEHRISRSVTKCAHSLRAWEDTVLAAAASVDKVFEKDVLILLLPMVGEVEYMDETGQLFSVAAGQLMLIPLCAGVKATVRNVYQDALVNCLVGAVDLSASAALYTPELRTFSLKECPGKLQDIENAYLPLYIGAFMGREEAMVRVAGKKLFVFVLEGAFEVQHRLLEYRDGMVMWNADQLELEALSNQAIILMMGLDN